MFVLLVLFLHLVYADVPQRVSQNTLILYNSTSLESEQHIVYAVNGGFGPSVWLDGSLDFQSIVIIEDCCSKDTLPSKESLPSEFVVLTKRTGCSYLKKARLVEQLNASGLILINRELEEGLLFPPLPELSYLTSSESIKIPVMLVKKPFGDLLSKSSFVSIYCAKSHNRTLIRAWNFHWIFWTTIFAILLCCSVVSFIVLFRETTVNPIIRPCIFLTMLSASVNIMDLLTDHWNIRGIISEVGFQLMYWFALDALLYMYILTQWLWYRMLDEKDLLKYKAIRINKPTIYAITIIVFLAGVIKIIMIGCGVTVMITWRAYNTILIVFLSGVGICTGISGVRLRKRLKKMIHKTNKKFKLTFMMIFGNFGMFFTSLTLLIWIIAPDIFGVYSWFIFHFYWRFACAFFGFLFLFIYGTKIGEGGVTGSSHSGQISSSPQGSSIYMNEIKVGQKEENSVTNSVEKMPNSSSHV